MNLQEETKSQVKELEDLLNSLKLTKETIMSQQEIESMIQAAVKAANEKQKKEFDRKI